jgi:hypothetical protein
MDSLKFHPGPTCPTLLRPSGGPAPKRPYGCLRGGPPAERAACGRLLPLWVPHAARACFCSALLQLLEFYEDVRGRREIKSLAILVYTVEERKKDRERELEEERAEEDERRKKR